MTIIDRSRVAVFPASEGRRPADWGASLLRVALGCMWLAHGSLKLFVFTLPGTARYFESVGLPGWTAYPMFVAEIAGGAAILAGFYGRQVSLLLAPTLLVAAWVHWPNGWVHTSPNGGWEYPVFLAIASLVHWLIGDGAVALRTGDVLAPRRASTGRSS